MATKYYGTQIPASGGAVTVHTGAGELQAIMVSHSQAGAETVTLYNNTEGSGVKLAVLVIPAGLQPFYFKLDPPAVFSTGLTVDPDDAEVTVWAVGS